MKDELRKVSLKNYIILAIVLLVSIGLLYYFYLWYSAYRENKLSISIMDRYMDKINYNELDNYLIENNDAIIYVSILNDEEIRSFEKDFKSLFKKKYIKYKVLYMDVTSDIDEFNKRYNGIHIPSIMTYSDRVLDSVYEIDTDAYSLDSIKKYINSVVSDSEIE